MKSNGRFKSTGENGLDKNHVMFHLWQKSKKLGIWNPNDIDFSRDIEDWNSFDESQKEFILHVGSLFLAGEEAVTLDLLPLIKVTAEEGRLEEEMYLASFLWEEAKHVDFFRRFLDVVIGDPGDLNRFHTENYKDLFYKALPEAMNRLYVETSPEAQVEASVTYNMIVEGMLAETGYYGFYQALERNNYLPGMMEGITLVQKDESRHMRFGVYFISRLVAEHGESVWETAEGKMSELLTPAIGLINDLFDEHEAKFGEIPFGLDREVYVEYGMSQFQKRMNRIEKSRTQTLDELIHRRSEEFST